MTSALSEPVDSTVQRQVAAARQVALQLHTGKVKFNGPVTFQLGGTGNQANSTDATKARAPVAAAPHATATNASRQGGTPWQVYVGLVVVCLALGAWLGTKLGAFSWLAKLRAYLS